LSLDSDEQKKCDSRIWWQKIKEAAGKFEKLLNDKWNENSVFIQLDEKEFDSALKMYECGWWTFKEHVYGEAAEEEHIDRHKIASLYILSFLIKKPFQVSVGKESKKANKHLLLANELFSLVILQTLLSAWNENKLFVMGENEKAWFIILLNLFKLKFEKSNPAKISDDPSNVTDLLSLAQVIYYIEKSYF